MVHVGKVYDLVTLNLPNPVHLHLGSAALVAAGRLTRVPDAPDTPDFF